MMYRVLFIYLLISGCNSQQPKAVTKNSIDLKSLNAEIIGEWGGFNESSPVMRIDKDSVFYFSNAKSYPYQVIGRSLIVDCSIDYGRKDTMSNIRFSKDTMFYLFERNLRGRSHRFK